MTLNTKLSLLLLHSCNSATVMNHNINIRYATHRGLDPQVEIHRLKAVRSYCSTLAHVDQKLEHFSRTLALVLLAHLSSFSYSNSSSVPPWCGIHGEASRGPRLPHALAEAGKKACSCPRGMVLLPWLPVFIRLVLL